MIEGMGDFLKFVLPFVVVALISLTILSAVDDRFQSMNESVIPAEAKLPSENLNTKAPLIYDFTFVAILLILAGFDFYLARNLNPSGFSILLVIGIFLVLGFVAMMIENFWEVFSTNSALSTTVGSMTFLPFIMNHLIYVVVFYVFIFGITYFTRSE